MEKPKSAMASPNIQGQTPRPPSVKSVSIAPSENNTTSLYKDQESDSEYFNLDRTPKLHRSSISRRIVGRPSVELLQKARTPAEILKLRSHTTSSSHVDAMESSGDAPLAGAEPSQRSRSSHLHGHLSYRDLLRWIQKEKARRAAAKARKKAEQSEDLAASSYIVTPAEEIEPATDEPGDEHKRRPSNASSEGSVALNMLHEILEQQMTLQEKPTLRSGRSSRTSLYKKFRRHSTAGSSDTDHGDPLVPTCEAFLDNSRTLSISGSVVDDESRPPHLGRSLSARERDAWKEFKFEILRLAHTLKLKGWRRVPLDRSDSISVERLSGALTNAVYVVNPPKRLLEDELEVEIPRRHRPRKLLLRIYGSQVDHLIDRDGELQILRRLAQKRIGPRLLGTFTNGRFEEFLNAKPLTSEEPRDRDISRQIAKRMRELHDGIELLEPEIEAGPFVWQNINKWIARAEKVVPLLETAYQNSLNLNDTFGCSKDKFYLLGADFDLFKEALKRYKKWLEDMYDGEDGIKDRLVFSHNDAQCGNILRLFPESESPLLLPTNEHKRLVVIDFEYANANVPGLEFANHFTEWCYDYSDEKHPHVCRVTRYPTPNEQINFLAAYVTHRPSFNPAPGTLAHRLSMSPMHSPHSSYPSTPAMLPMSSTAPTESAASAQSSLILPAPATAPLGFGPVPLGDDDVSVKWEVERLRREARAWRGVNSAQWVLWGIVQAKLPSHLEAEVKEANKGDLTTSEATSGPEPKKNEEVVEEEEEDGEDVAGFDYVGYSQERAAFFWGDILSLGIMTEKELPEDIVKGARILDY